MKVADIIHAIRSGQVRITDHADEEAVADQITIDEVLYSVVHGEIIEDYLADKPYPSCLVLGKTPSGVVLHSVWAYNTDSRWAVLVTVYRPDPKRWIDWRHRRRT